MNDYPISRTIFSNYVDEKVHYGGILDVLATAKYHNISIDMEYLLNFCGLDMKQVIDYGHDKLGYLE